MRFTFIWLTAVSTGCVVSTNSAKTDATSAAGGSSLTTGGASGAANGGNAGSGASAGSSASAGSGSSPIAPPSTVVDPPSGGALASGGQTTLTLSQAPGMSAINVTANRSSVLLHLPGVAGARDYRVFADDGSVIATIDASGHEHIAGATVHCAGLVQRNQCNDDEVVPISYSKDQFTVPRCESAASNRPNVPTALMQTLEVNGIAANTTLIVEAIDTQCPFPGLFGSTHRDVPITLGNGDLPPTADVIINGTAYSNLPFMMPTFPLRTEAEIRGQYGSMILNGQGPNMPSFDPHSPGFPQTSYIGVGQPAPAVDPIVLARSVITVSPTGDAALPAGFTNADYFDDFDDNSDQPVTVSEPDYLNTIMPNFTMAVYQTSKWYLYDVANQFSDFFVDRGQLHMVMGDPYQDSMSMQAMYPKRPVQLPSLASVGSYLHVTYEVQVNETDRRYFNLNLCGDDAAGKTYVGDRPKSSAWPKPNFMNGTANPTDGNPGPTTETNPFGWNCLQLVPRGRGYGVTSGGDIVSHSDTSLNVSVMHSHPAPTTSNFSNANADSESNFARPYLTEVAPNQGDVYPNRFERQIDAAHHLSGVWLDDQLNVWQRTHFDVFIRRDQVIIYVNGGQRLCANLTGNAVLTMAEGALGFWNILYHTSAEFGDIRADAGGSGNPATGQHHIMHNTPFASQRSFDNVGFRENVAAPADFDPARCFAPGENEAH